MEQISLSTTATWQSQPQSRPRRAREHGTTEQPQALLRARTRKLGLKLLHQQGWCWGCDIKRPDGNLLLAHGFTWERPPEGMLGSSAYHLTPAAGEQLSIWGLGLLYRWDSHGAIYVGRYTFLPALLDTPVAPLRVWASDDLPPGRPAESERDRERARQLLARAVRRIVAYEGWVIATQGLAYREQCLERWRQKSLPAPEAIAAWLKLAEECEQA